MSNVTCNKCGWVHFSVSLEFCKKWEDDWKVFFKGLNATGKKAYGLKKPPKIEDEYLNCMYCGNTYKDFRDSVEGDCPNGCTINPILDRNEDFAR